MHRNHNRTIPSGIHLGTLYNLPIDNPWFRKYITEICYIKKKCLKYHQDGIDNHRHYSNHNFRTNSSTIVLRISFVVDSDLFRFKTLYWNNTLNIERIS
ncbi:hypothetical protein CEXT_681371 [Caerostris extrusa]|uniref:Uncharacterized protein n=1 Tax=Caerostris extrusa TaxID=172846 RepID=A0AAV4RBB0_CAEEX|nr:hypothetical protein CEXT_681371 [Caerostris extrusa]